MPTAKCMKNNTLVGLCTLMLGLVITTCDNLADLNDKNPTVINVSISPQAVSVVKGETRAFTVTVTGKNDPAQTVTWSIVEQDKHNQTLINSSGILRVSASESLTSLTVRAVSIIDNSKGDVAFVTVTDAAVPAAADFIYSGDTTLTITGYIGTGGNISIPAAIDGKPVTAIADGVYPNGVFQNKNLSNVTIPDSIVSIGEAAFAGNQLTIVSIPNNVTSIGKDAFMDNQLTSLKIGSNVSSIGRYAFGSNQLTTLKIPDNVSSMGIAAFMDNQLASVNIPDSIKSIDEEVFRNNRLTSITIGAEVMLAADNGDHDSFGNGFESAYNSSNKAAGTYTRSNTASSVWARTVSDADFIYEGSTTLTITGYKGAGGNVIIPAAINGKPVVAIADAVYPNGVFQNKNLSSISIPVGITFIGDDAFAENQLTGISLSDGLKSIGKDAFARNQLGSVSIPDSVTVIGQYAFGENQLTSVIIGNSVSSIEEAAFARNQLSIVTIPDSVITVGQWAFGENPLISVTIGANAALVSGDFASIGNGFESMYSNNSMAEGTYIRANTDATVWNRANSTDFIYNESPVLTIIGYNGTGGEVIIPATIDGKPISAIGEYALYNKQLTGVIIPAGITSIGIAAFMNNQLTSITIGANVNLASGNDASFGNNGFEDAYNNSKMAGTYTRDNDKTKIWKTTINFNNLTGNNIYLIKVNTSGSIVNAASTGRTLALSPEPQSSSIAPLPYSTLEELPRMGHPAADNYHANPPPFERKRPRRSDEGRSLAALVPYTVGSTRQFWVESAYNNGNWIQRPATMAAQGTYGNIWVINNSISTAQAEALAAKFDIIYPAETNLLGYEYGGGLLPDDPDYGGYDDDPRIQILVYDLGSGSGSGVTLGYFWGKDMRYDTGSGTRSNEAEMFYLNSYAFSAFGPDTVYTTLIHEFQHMINYSRKSMKKLTSATWYNEMLSMMAEDLVSPLLEINASNQSHPIMGRIPRFLGNYNAAGITEWGSSGDTLDSYSIAYAFGAYLLRNYGGAVLIKNILDNNTSNIDSITAALNEFSTGVNFEQALTRFGEAMIYSGSTIPANVMTYDKTVTSTINDFTYTAYRFNIWNMNRSGGAYGPVIFNVNPMTIRPHSISLHQTINWRYRWGNYSITLEMPADPHVKLYFLK